MGFNEFRMNAIQKWQEINDNFNNNVVQPMQQHASDKLAEKLQPIQENMHQQLAAKSQAWWEFVNNLFKPFLIYVMSVVAVGLVVYLVYLCVKYMFIGKHETFQRMLFTTFALLLVRIFIVIVGVNM